LDGLINVQNGGGSQNFAAGQFGFTPNFQVPPIILPVNPGMQFSPPPNFSAGNPPNGNTSPPDNANCIVRFAPETESDVARRANEVFSALGYDAPNVAGGPVLVASNPGPQFNPPANTPGAQANPQANSSGAQSLSPVEGALSQSNYCDYAPNELAELKDDASGDFRLSMYSSAEPANPIDAFGLGGASITHGSNLGVTDAAGLVAPGTTFGFRDTSGGGGIIASYGVSGLPAEQHLTLRGMFSYQQDSFGLSSFAGVGGAASARTDSYGFSGAAIYNFGQNYLVGSGGYKLGNGSESVSLNGSAGSFDTRGYWADLKAGHVFMLVNTISWGGSPGPAMVTKAPPTKAPPQSNGGYALGLDAGVHVGYSNGQVAGFTDNTGFIFASATARYDDGGAYARLFAVIPNGQFVWTPYALAAVDREFGFCANANIPVQAALPAGDSVSLQQALTFWSAKAGVNARIPNGWVLGVEGFYQASADINTAGGAVSLLVPINYTPPPAFGARY
jgi:hypothetical protein